MSTHTNQPCGCLELPRADAWTAHASVEQWLRSASAQAADGDLERLAVGSRLLKRLETGDRMTHEELSLLAECCRSRLNDRSLPPRERESLTAVLSRIEQALVVCSN